MIALILVTVLAAGPAVLGRATGSWSILAGWASLWLAAWLVWGGDVSDPTADPPYVGVLVVLTIAALVAGAIATATRHDHDRA